jgi:branched-chain amino acid transport system permease protein
MSAVNNKRWVWAAFALLLAAAVVLPFLVKNYRVFQFNLVLVYAIAILGLNILTGFNGQISLGHGAFYAIGAYGAAIMMDRLGMPYWATLLPAGALCFVVGYLMGFPALRLGGHYLAVATLALALAVPQLLKYKHLEHYTGGVQGIVLVKPEPPFTFRFLDQPFNADRWLYFFTLAVTVVMFVLAWNLLRGRVGRALIAIRDHPIAAAVMGVNLPVFKSLTFGVSAAFTGVAGALGAVAIAFVSPDSFQVTLSIFLLVGLVVGGLASIPGAFFGAIFIQFVPNIADEMSKSAPAAIYGVLLIILMYLLPTGVMGMVRRLWARWQPGAARSRINVKPGSSSVPVPPDLTRSSPERPQASVAPRGAAAEGG